MVFKSVLFPQPFNVITQSSAQNGADIESINSIKYYAPKIYSAQNRAVTGRDYESIIKKITPDTINCLIFILYYLMRYYKNTKF